MDPDQALADLRAAFAEWSQIPIRDPREPEILARVAERWGALDHWMSTGGFLPADWQGAKKDLIQVKARHATADEVTEDVRRAINATIVPREITPESAVAIAGQWQSSGSVGSVLAGFASGATVDRGELLEDIRRTRETVVDGLALFWLARFVVRHH